MLIRKAKISDVEDIYKLITCYANQGQMLPRARSTLYECIREFAVAEIDGKIVGAGSLHVFWEDLAEIRALAVAPEHVGKGIGKALVQTLLAEAKDLGLPTVFSLTYKPGFFVKCGFRQVEKEALPQKVWKECVNCPQFPNCEEIAVIINLT